MSRGGIRKDAGPTRQMGMGQRKQRRAIRNGLHKLAQFPIVMGPPGPIGGPHRLPPPPCVNPYMVPTFQCNSEMFHQYGYQPYPSFSSSSHSLLPPPLYTPSSPTTFIVQQQQEGMDCEGERGQDVPSTSQQTEPVISLEKIDKTNDAAKDDSEKSKEKKKKRKKSKEKDEEKARRKTSKSTGPTLGHLMEDMKKKESGEEEKGEKKRKRKATISGDEESKAKREQKEEKEESEKKKDAEVVVEGGEEKEDICTLTEEDLVNVDFESDEEIFDESNFVVRNYETSTVVVGNCTVKLEEDTNIKREADDLKPSRSTDILSRFREDVSTVIRTVRISLPDVSRPESPDLHGKCKCGHASSDDDSSSSSESESEDEEESEKKERGMTNGERIVIAVTNEVERKRTHPAALSRDIAFNEVGQGNDGPVCRCSLNSRKKGIRHDKYAGEGPIPACVKSESPKLFHYVLKVSPSPSLTGRRTSFILFEGENYNLDGFSVYLHRPLPKSFPRMPVNRFTNEYEFELLRAEDTVMIGSVAEMDAFREYLFVDLLELFDLSLGVIGTPNDDTNCPFYHLAPRYMRKSKGQSTILSLSAVLSSLHSSFSSPICTPEMAEKFKTDRNLFNSFVSDVRGQLVVNPQKRPSTIRVDSIDRHDSLGESTVEDGNDGYPRIVHYAVRPMAYTLNGRPEYQKAVRQLPKMRAALKVKGSAATQEQKDACNNLDRRVQKMSAESQQRRECAVSISLNGYRSTGFAPDIVHHAMMAVLAVSHVRYHCSLEEFEKRISYSFRDRRVLELAFTHPSYRKNFGTNSDHARNAIANCGMRGRTLRDMERKETNKKKGLNALVEIMAKPGSKKVEVSPISHNERLEFLGDAVVEFINTVHLYFSFPELQEGGLATYRTALVQNRNLSLLAKRLGLDDFMLFAHGPDLCHDADMRHAMANAFEATMAAIYLDGGIEHCERIFGEVMFEKGTDLYEKWMNLPEHRLKSDFPLGDRHLIPTLPQLQQLTVFEKEIGLSFQHIRLLAKAFTRRNVPVNNLTHGHNQRLEFLGDSVLQLIVSDYLYKHFPNHLEGHLSLLRTCLVSNKTLSVISDDLTLSSYLVMPSKKKKPLGPLKVKEKADLVEALIGAVYVDRGWTYCKTFCKVCFFPRLKHFISDNKWNDAKSQLQQSCLLLREAGTEEPDIPEYRTISVFGPSNTRKYEVAVYFKGKRLAVGNGNTIQTAQMNAAERALEEHGKTFTANKKTKREPPTPLYPPPPPGKPPSLLSLSLPSHSQHTLCRPPPPLLPPTPLMSTILVGPMPTHNHHQPYTVDAYGGFNNFYMPPQHSNYPRY